MRGAVLALAALPAIAFWAFEPLSGPDRVFWLIVGLGAGAAGLASSSRIAGLPPESLVARERVKSMTADAAARAARAARARRPGEGSSWGDVAGVLVPRTIGDAAVATLVTTVGMAVWVAMRVVDGGWTAGLVSSLITTPIATLRPASRGGRARVARAQPFARRAACARSTLMDPLSAPWLVLGESADRQV